MATQTKQPESITIGICVSKHQAENIRALAKADGRSVSGFLKRLIERAIGASDASLPDPANSEAALAAIGNTGNGAD